VTFNYAHWIFAFNYWALSLKLRLVNLKRPADTYQFHLRVVYWIVVAYICLFPLLGCIFNLMNFSLAYTIMYLLSDFSLVVSCSILTDGLVRMIRCMTENHLVNINYLIANILVFLIVIVTPVLSDIPFKKKEQV